MQKILPKEITSYDLLKTYAVLLMIADHIGYYFYPDEMWWRVFGRMCVPVWFFLIGYARSRDMGPKLWIGGAILLAGNFLAGMSILPFNILFTMIIVRLMIDSVAKGIFQHEKVFWAVCAMMVVLILPTALLYEYGTQSLIVALYGYMLRHREDMNISRSLIDRYFAFALVMFVFPQWLMFGTFNNVHFAVLCAGILVVMAALSGFRPQTYPRLTAALPGFAGAALRFTGRRTLEIYVAHLLLFKALGVMTQPDRFVFLDWKWFSLTGT